MNPKDLLKQYLEEAKLLQLATVQDSKPWVCTVWFVNDTNFTLYWDSRTIRRHSQELSTNPHVAGAIVKPHIQGRGEKVRGVQFEGIAKPVNSEDIPKVHKLYYAKYPLVPKPLEEYTPHDAPAIFYEVKPTRFVLFDEVNFPNEPQQEILL